MNQSWLIEHVIDALPALPASPHSAKSDRAYLTRREAEDIVDATLDRLGAHAEEGEYTYMRGHRTRLIETLTMIPRAEGPGARLLDVGSYGYMAHWAKAHLGYEEVVGIEWHPGRDEPVIDRTLRIGEDEVLLRSHNLDIREPEWDVGDGFDTVLFFEVLEHIDTDPMGVMERLNRVLRMGGTLVMSVPNAVSYKTLREFLVGMPPWTYWFYEPDLAHEPRHCFEYTPLVFLSLLVAAGMETDAFRTIYAYSTPEQEAPLLGVAEALGFDHASFGETMIAHATKAREGVALRYPDVLYSPEGYYRSVYPRLEALLRDRVETFQRSTAPDPDHHRGAEPDRGATGSRLIEAKPARAFDDEIAHARDELVRVTQENADLHAQVIELLFACDCYLQQINDPARCARVIRERRFRRALDRSKAIARKAPVARTVLRPVYRNMKKAIKRRM